MKSARILLIGITILIAAGCSKPEPNERIKEMAFEGIACAEEAVTREDKEYCVQQALQNLKQYTYDRCVERHPDNPNPCAIILTN